MSSSAWCTIESDPAVFTEMLESLGVKGVAVEELIALDQEFLSPFRKVYGLILLFKWKPEPPGTQPNPNHQLKLDAPVFFAKQVVGDACATQALLNTIFNFPGELPLGQDLTQFLEFSLQMDPAMRGELIGQSDLIRKVHNSFARSTAFSFMPTKAKDDDDVYHFVSFIYKCGAIWELDGLKPGPVEMAKASDADWLNVLIQVVQGRIQELGARDTSGTGQGISFTLMAVVSDPLIDLPLKIEELRRQEQSTADLQEQLRDMTERRERGKLENVRRRHNYVPLVVELLKALNEKGKLGGIVEAAKKKSEEKQQARAAKKGAGGGASSTATGASPPSS